MDDGRYHQLGGRLKPVLDSIAAIHGMGFWLEVVTLIVPGFNDAQQELEALARFLVGISPDIPWHVTAFHKSYKMSHLEDTGAPTLKRAAAIGRAAGLRYVYGGNLGGHARDLENTRCASCRALLIERDGFRVIRNHVTAAGCCPMCGSFIPGFWRADSGQGRPNDLWVHGRCG
jgi:pyruvate formate lyase activating enzyme